MTLVFHCYEFLLLKRLDEDPSFWRELQENFSKEKPQKVQGISPDLWFLAITLEKTRERFPRFVRNFVTARSTPLPARSDSLLTRYLNDYDFVELHLDSIFKYGEGGTLPLELFRCINVRALSLKYNFLESLPSDIGRLQKLEYLALTNNRLQNSSIPRTLSFCLRLRILFLDNNLLDALPGFLLNMPSLQTVHRHGNHNYFKATFMWYHTDLNGRILAIEPHSQSQALHPPRGEEEITRPSSNPAVPALQFLSAQTVIAAKMNFFASPGLPQILTEYIADIYHKFNVCGNCPKAKMQYLPGYKVFTFKNPYLGNTCVPFQHWACSFACAKAIEVPARIEQMLSSLEQDREYNRYVRQAQQDRCISCQHRTPNNPVNHVNSTTSAAGCNIL